MMTLTYPVITTSKDSDQKVMTSPCKVTIIPTTSSVMNDVHRGSFMGLGVTQIVIGILSILFNIGACTVFSVLTLYVAPGLWSGALFIITGSFGFAGGKRRNRSLVVAFLVMSLISACASIVVFSIASDSVGLDLTYYPHNGPHQNAAIAMDAFLVALGAIELLIAIVSSAICCSALFCRRHNTVLHINTPGTESTYVAKPDSVLLQKAVSTVSHHVPFPDEQQLPGQGSIIKSSICSGIFSPYPSPTYHSLELEPSEHVKL